MGLLCSSNFVTFLLRSATILPNLRTFSSHGVSCNISTYSIFKQARYIIFLSFCLLSSSSLTFCLVLCIFPLIFLIAFLDCFTYLLRVLPLTLISVTASFCKACTSTSHIFEKSKNIWPSLLSTSLDSGVSISKTSLWSCTLMVWYPLGLWGSSDSDGPGTFCDCFSWGECSTTILISSIVLPRSFSVFVIVVVNWFCFLPRSWKLALAVSYSVVASVSTSSSSIRKVLDSFSSFRFFRLGSLFSWKLALLVVPDLVVLYLQIRATWWKCHHIATCHCHRCDVSLRRGCR